LKLVELTELGFKASETLLGIETIGEALESSDRPIQSI